MGDPSQWVGVGLIGVADSGQCGGISLLTLGNSEAVEEPWTGSGPVDSPGWIVGSKEAGTKLRTEQVLTTGEREAVEEPWGEGNVESAGIGPIGSRKAGDEEARLIRADGPTTVVW